MTFGVQFDQLLSKANQLPSNTLATWQSVLVFAPHPDDESLGCAGLLAKLRKLGKRIHVVVVSDGAKSHPQSVRFSEEDRIRIREQESIAAAKALGFRSDHISFLRYPDTSVPSEADPTEVVQEAVYRITNLINTFRPDQVLTCWRRDPHCDHRATNLLVHRAVAASDLTLNQEVTIWEYPIWVWESKEQADLPRAEEGLWYAIDIRSELSAKQQSIHQHRSQIIPMYFDDDPG